MVYKSHQIWRDTLGVGAGYQTVPSHYKFGKKLKTLRNSKPNIPYTLEIECNSYWGNFEREFLGYALGILDDVQMNIDFADKERAMFWKEVFNSDEVVSFEDALDSYELLRDYLFETFQDVDDWEQLTFYEIDWEAMHKEDRNILVVQLAKPLSVYWEEIIIPRMKRFFELKIYEYMDKDAELTGITLCSKGHNPIKSY